VEVELLDDLLALGLDRAQAAGRYQTVADDLEVKVPV